MKAKSFYSSFVLVWLTLSAIISLSCAENKEPVSTKPLGYFTNPILEDGPDPYVYLHNDGFYYSMVTRGDRLKLWKSRSFTSIADTEGKEIWYPPQTGTNTCCIWAPEIHYFDNVWYIYYSATDAKNSTDLYRNVYVLRNRSVDPLQGEWEDLGKVNTKYAGIDGHVFEYRGVRYFAYSPYIGNQSGIILSRMTSPTTIENERNLGLPVYDWEMTPPRAILEGPQFLEGPKDKVFIIYSAGACWDDNYGLGWFMADKDSDLLNPDSWSRSLYQVFEQNPDSSVFGPGHNCFTKSPDGTEDWIVYHAKRYSSNECSGRSMRAQKFEWDIEGRPVFGPPVSVGTPYPMPSGINP